MGFRKGMRFRVSGFRVFGFGVWVQGCRGLGLRASLVFGLFGVQGLRFRAWGSDLGIVGAWIDNSSRGLGLEPPGRILVNPKP